MSSYTTFNANTGNTNTTANFLGLDNGKYYQFRVSAINSEGSGVVSLSDKALLSGPPNVVTSLTPTIGANSVSLSWTKPSSSGGKLITGYKIESKLYAQTVSDAPASVSATAGNGECVVSWDAPTNFGYSDITGYKVEYAVSPYNTWSVATASINSLTYTVTGLTNGTSYKFRVSLINGVGTSSPRESSIATPQAVPPGPPTSLTVSAGNQQFTGSWTAPTNNGGSTITGYDLLYAPGPSYNSFTTVSIGNITSYTVLSLTNGTSYKFKVSAKNSAGTGTVSALSSAVTPSVILPSAPTNVSGTPGYEKVPLSWTAPGLNGGPAITDYKIEYKVSTDSWPATPLSVLAGDTDTSEDVTGLTNGTAYNFRVYAITTIGTGPASSETGNITPTNTYTYKFEKVEHNNTAIGEHIDDFQFKVDNVWYHVGDVSYASITVHYNPNRGGVVSYIYDTNNTTRASYNKPGNADIGDIFMTLELTGKRASHFKMEFQRPKYAPGYKILENDVVVLNDTTDPRSSDENPVDINYIYTPDYTLSLSNGVGKIDVENGSQVWPE